MKLTFKQRLKILFTGEMPEPLIAFDKNAFKLLDAGVLRSYNPTVDEPAPYTPPQAVVIPERKAARSAAASVEHKRRKPRYSKYSEQAKACRAHPECWQQIATTPVRSTANALVSKIRHGGLPPFHKPRGGRYEARASLCMGMRLVEARFMPNNKNKENTK